LRIRIVYFFEEALNSFRHNWVMSFAAILVVLVSVLLVGSFLIMGHMVGRVATGIEDKIEIDVYLKDSAPQEQIYAIERKIKAFKEVESVEFVSKKEALDIFIERNKDNKDLITQVAGNPLPASYRVFLKDPHTVEKVSTKINHFPEKDASIEEIKYGGREFIRRLFVVTRWLRVIMFILIIFLCFTSLALISNTIRLAIFARRKEIAIMRLVGASNWFIRWPFLLEGIIQGLAGALLAIAVLSSVKYVLLGKLENQMTWFVSTLQVNPQFYQNMLWILLASGVVIGSAGSIIALRRYLKI